MNVPAFLIYYITPYLAVLVFAGGIVYRLFRWRRAMPVAAHLSVFPRPRTMLNRLFDTLIDMFTMKGLLRVSAGLWLAGFIMHFGLFFVLVGHVRAFTDFHFLWDLLNWGRVEVHRFSAVSGTIAGSLFVVPLFFLLIRRFGLRIKVLSAPEDYLVLLLLIGIGLTGFHMRFLRDVEVDELHRFFSGLASLDRQPYPKSAGPAFLYHFAMVQVLMVYFPFGKLMHVIGSVFSKLVAKS